MREDGQPPEGVSIHTGFPNPAADKSLHGIDLNKQLIKHPVSTFLFRVRGHEWEGVGIFDKDTAVVDRILDPRKNDVVLWWREASGEFTLSHYRDLPPDAQCWGVVTATIHEFRTNAT